MGIIKLKRGQSENFPNLELEMGEPAFILDTGKLYIGDGSHKILINPDLAENAETASKLRIPRKIAISGDVTATGIDFDGSKDVTLTALLPNKGTEGTYTKITTDEKGRVVSGDGLTINDIPQLTLSKISDVGTAASKNIGTNAGQVPVLDPHGKLERSIIPAVAITDTFVVSTQTDMLTLNAQIGDVAIRTDIEKSFILAQEPATTFSNWEELVSPSDKVSSVNSKTGNVVITKHDIDLGNVTNESKSTMFTSPTFTGTPTAPTPLTSDNGTRIATTAFVKAQGFLTSLPFHNHDDLYEPKFTKNTAFNKNFGTIAGTVAEGNHTHTQYLTASSTIDGGMF